MRTIFNSIYTLALSVVLVLFFASCTTSKENTGKKTVQNKTLQSGDIIFQSTSSEQCQAVKLATHSKFSHVGIIVVKDHEKCVLEAVQPVRITPLKDFIARGIGQEYEVKRLIHSDSLLPVNFNQLLLDSARNYLGKDYDIYFNWSDEEIYCSELVWKLFESILKIEVGTPKALKDYDLSHPLVKAIMEQRYGKHIPWNEQMVAPADIYVSAKLYTVASKP